MYPLATIHSVTDRQTDDSIMPTADQLNLSHHAVEGQVNRVELLLSGGQETSLGVATTRSSFTRVVREQKNPDYPQN